MLKCISHNQKINEWDFERFNPPNEMFQLFISASGLASLVKTTYKFVNKIVVSAFVERWYPETNTFHMPFGEITITLDDVSCLLGIPVVSRVIYIPYKLILDDAVILVSVQLGVLVEDAREELVHVRGTSVRLEWLRSIFDNVDDKSNSTQIECAAKAYLLFLLGCTLFVDKSSTRVSIAYLEYLKNLYEVQEYAWGTAALAHIYSHLGSATRVEVKQMIGYITLLEAWVYERFSYFIPNCN